MKRPKLYLAVIGLASLAAPVLIGVVNPPQILAQEATDWQVKAGGRMSFDAASVKPMKAWKQPAFALGPDDAKPRGGRFYATFPLRTYIQFAYKLAPFQIADAMASAPKWLSTDEYDIEAEAQGNPTKDQMRLMMQSLLADRFGLAVHFENKEHPVLALTEVKTGKLGPKLVPHSQGPPCPDDYGAPAPGADLSNPKKPAFPPVPDPSKDVFPSGCVAGQSVGKGGTWWVGSRNATMATAAVVFYNYGSMAGEIDLPVVDQTGLKGTFDFVLQYEPANNNGMPAPARQASDAREFGGTSFVEALRKQLGLKLVRAQAPVRTLLIDRVKRPSEN